jgi:ATP-dependent helicase HrpB
MLNRFNLPIDEVLPGLRKAFARGTRAVLSAPPGSGKTTCVPLALLEEPWLKGGRIIMLEPRRLAARAACRRMSAMLGQDVGGTIGYRIRRETQVGPATRIEVVTEGILTRMLQSDPGLEGVGLVIFDEFHERSLNADLGLALCLDAQQAVRDDLHVLIMSATMDCEAVSRLLGGAPVLSGQGRLFDVATRYRGSALRLNIEAEAAATIARALGGDRGSLLAFLPGEAEIRRTAELLAKLPLPPDVAVLPLYGNLPRQDQDRAIAPATQGSRKVVLATSIAETSLTIDGVNIVVDSGLMRLPRFDARSAMTRLVTVPVTRASADQRRGRAGRTGPGVCYRLWTESQHGQLQEYTPPEIRSADLAPLALELALWGETDATRLLWLDPPPAGALAQAHSLLQELDALDGEYRITEHGRRIAALPVHPRLGHMLVHGAQMGLGRQACLLAALLSERDILRFAPGMKDADLRLRLEVLLDASAPVAGYRVERQLARQIREQAADLQHLLQIPAGHISLEATGSLLSHAYPDRIAMRRGPDAGYLLAGGRGAQFDRYEPLSAQEFLVAAHLGGGQRSARIFLAAAYSRAELEKQFAEHIKQEESIGWDHATRAVLACSRMRFGSLVLDERPLRKPDTDKIARALFAGIASEGLHLLPWNRELRAWQERVLFLRRVLPEQEWPDVSDTALAADMVVWLLPFVQGMSRAEHLQRLHLKEALYGLLPWRSRQRLDELAPTHLAVPSGSRIALDYSGQEPVLAVRLQELFGLKETPRIAAGRAAVMLHLLSPALRPVQVTRDLANFWAVTYFEVRRELLPRYPKHYWPEDPLAAQPTSRTKPRR